MNTHKTLAALAVVGMAMLAPLATAAMGDELDNLSSPTTLTTEATGSLNPGDEVIYKVQNLAEDPIRLHRPRPVGRRTSRALRVARLPAEGGQQCGREQVHRPAGIRDGGARRFDLPAPQQGQQPCTFYVWVRVPSTVSGAKSFVITVTN
ncbi:MAG: hypothetical protein HYY22_09810 [Thaumarchaeota archaeon]|nr:hypothetical protein [Nitrososphaerota archaeon]